MTTLRYLPALGKALRDEMERDAAVFVVGEDVRQSLRGITKGLLEEFGDERVLDMRAGMLGRELGVRLFEKTA